MISLLSDELPSPPHVRIFNSNTGTPALDVSNQLLGRGAGAVQQEGVEVQRCARVLRGGMQRGGVHRGAGAQRGRAFLRGREMPAQSTAQIVGNEKDL
jgi:hypothetical protein